jgi:hypothetical protein
VKMTAESNSTQLLLLLLLLQVTPLRRMAP